MPNLTSNPSSIVAFTGEDVLSYKKEWGMTTQQMQVLLGISSSSWNSFTKNNNTVIKNRSTQILLHHYINHKEDLPTADPKRLLNEFVTQIKRVRPNTWEEDMLIILGNKSITCKYRWLEYGDKMHPSTASLAKLITQKLSSYRTKKEAESFLKELEYVANHSSCDIST